MGVGYMYSCMHTFRKFTEEREGENRGELQISFGVGGGGGRGEGEFFVLSHWTFASVPFVEILRVRAHSRVL